MVRFIILTSGRSSTANGETFPCTLPGNVHIVGPAPGWRNPGRYEDRPIISVGIGTLEDIEFEDV